MTLSLIRQTHVHLLQMNQWNFWFEKTGLIDIISVDHPQLIFKYVNTQFNVACHSGHSTNSRPSTFSMTRHAAEFQFHCKCNQLVSLEHAFNISTFFWHLMGSLNVLSMTRASTSSLYLYDADADMISIYLVWIRSVYSVSLRSLLLPLSFQCWVQTFNRLW